MPHTLKHGNDADNARNVMLTVAQYGFRKTSMDDLGAAFGVSRQAIYKRFGSKEKCYEWAVNTYLSDMHTRIFDALENDDVPPLRTLTNVMDVLIGAAVAILSNSHGTEVLDDALKTTHTSQEDWPLRLRSRLADFLARHNYASADNAKGVAFALISAGKGLLLEEATREQFNEDMAVIIKSVIQQSN